MRLFADRHYEAHLEAEVARLQRENRELVNAVLAGAGVPAALKEESKAEPQQPLMRRRNWRQIGRDMTQKTREAMRQLRPNLDAAAEKRVGAAQGSR